MKKGKIFILSGPSGSGKTSIYKKLLQSAQLKDKLVRSVSVTTRHRREGERHGRDYFFVSHKMFMYKKRRGQFLESQKVFDNYYGTPSINVKRLLKKGQNVLLCIDVKGARVVKQKFPKTVTIFVKTASYKILNHRLKKRASEKKGVLKLRLQTAREEMKESRFYDHIIINDNLKKVCEKSKAIILKELSDY